MSLKTNIIANIAGQAYVTLIGILLVPMYIRYMGAEAYGLVGFYAMLQAWFMILDMGLTPAMSREVARFRGGAVDAPSLLRLLRSMEGIFAAVGLVGAMAIMMGASAIATVWLKVQVLSLSEVQGSIMLMGAIIALRWLCGLYRGAINGFERIVWLNGFNAVVATARFALIIPFLVYVGATPIEFFSYQLAIAILETLGLVVQTYRLMPNAEGHAVGAWAWQPVRSVLKFALSIAFASVVWVLVTQTDKLILSKLLTLSDYAAYTLAALVASGIMAISGPVSNALLPRMIKLNAEGNESGLLRIYRNATQMVAVAVIPAALVLAAFPEQVLWAWTGNRGIAEKAAPVLALYAMGNGIMSLAAFPYYLQHAKGDLKLHLIGNALFVALFIPTLVWATGRYGMTGAGYAWLMANLLPFIIWLPVVHRRFIRGMHLQWLTRDVLSIMLLPTALAWFAWDVMVWPEGRMTATFYLLALCVCLGIAAAISSSWLREMLVQKWRNSSSAQGWR